MQVYMCVHIYTSENPKKVCKVLCREWGNSESTGHLLFISSCNHFFSTWYPIFFRFLSPLSTFWGGLPY